eukprot:9362665-Pyramimonas_sp.AAC.1
MITDHVPILGGIDQPQTLNDGRKLCTWNGLPLTVQNFRNSTTPDKIKPWDHPDERGSHAPEHRQPRERAPRPIGAVQSPGERSRH